jgi:phospholipase/carboxylesterase
VATPPAVPAPASDWGGLEAITSGPLREQDRGGIAAILLHGWGARGDDLLSAAQELARPGVRFILPAGPLPMAGGGRAWWNLDRNPPGYASLTSGPSQVPHPQVSAARTAVQALVRRVRERYAPDHVVIAGFSQGAMLAMDVALASSSEIDRVAALSGVLLLDSLGALQAPTEKRPLVYIAHGRKDGVVPFMAGEVAKALFERHGFTVTWRPFDGGHEIPRSVVSDLRTFLFADAPSP